MPEFLSDTWLAALDHAARACGPVAGVAPLVVEQVVTDVPGRGDVRYQLVFDDGGLRVRTEAGHPADVTFATDHATAVGIARGETNAQQALATGSFRVRGSVNALVARAGALVVIDDVFAAVRAGTTFARETHG